MKVVVALRHKDRVTGDAKVSSRRLSKLRSSAEKLRARLKRDLRSSDPSRFMTALAVALLDETGQDVVLAKKRAVRVNDDDPSSVSFKAGKGRARRVANPMVVQALLNAYETIDDDNDPLFAHDLGHVSTEQVAAYLGEFNLTSESLRGLRSNDVLQERLSEVRAKGGSLPSHWKSKQKVLRGEFEQALNDTAAVVGLDAATLRAKYLTPGLEAAFLKDGTLGTKTASASAYAVFLRTILSDS